MRILITRPVHQAERFAARLRAAGHRVVSSPMLEIAFPAFPNIDASGLQGLIVTSRNALLALERSGQAGCLLDVPVYVVGPASARIAGSLGFTNVIAGPSGARELNDIIASHATFERGRLVHLSGDVRAVAMDEVLAERGLSVETMVVYTARAAESLTDEAVVALRGGAMDAVILMSPRTSAIFCDLVLRAGLGEHTQALHYACISESAAGALSALGPDRARIHVPSQPRADALLDLVNRISPQSDY